jgi:hypothetical protein
MSEESVGVVRRCLDAFDRQDYATARSCFGRRRGRRCFAPSSTPGSARVHERTGPDRWAGGDVEVDRLRVAAVLVCPPPLCG